MHFNNREWILSVNSRSESLEILIHLSSSLFTCASRDHQYILYLHILFDFLHTNKNVRDQFGVSFPDQLAHDHPQLDEANLLSQIGHRLSRVFLDFRSETV